MSLLEVRGLEVRYGGIRAVKGIDLEIAAGEMVCLIGANGAGKSSTLRAILGLVPTAPGAVRFGGSDLAGAPAFRRARAGLVMVPEGRGVFAQLSVDENLAMGAYLRGDRRDRFGSRPRVRSVSAAPRAPGPDRRHALRRRAADARHRPRADEPAETARAG